MYKPQSAEHARIRQEWRDAGLLAPEQPRKGTPEQCRAYREAVHALHTQGLYEQRAGIREENPVNDRLNSRVCELEEPLSRWQAIWNFHRVDAEQDLIRLQAESGRQDRARTRPRIGRRDAKAYAAVATPVIERFWDDAARRGLTASRDHYAAILTDRARRAARRRFR